MPKEAQRNKTISLSPGEESEYRQRLLKLDTNVEPDQIIDRTICQDLVEICSLLPTCFIDLLITDPPYNLTKKFNQESFQQRSLAEYERWLDSWVSQLVPALKPTASIYVCGDWQSSAAIHRVCDKYFKIRNRITWEREKGRGALRNWKNNSEDIWFSTLSDQYTFNVDAVKLQKRVIAPYRDASGNAKDWKETADGRFRLTHPSNIWTDITVPFWSMPENTDHPTQKPEKLLAKMILASSEEGDIVFDPFLGSGTTSVVAKKLNRRYIGVELDPYYCCIAEKRLDRARSNKSIQGYCDGIFRERNTSAPPTNSRAQQKLETAVQPTLNV